jgi:hypothetical protein
MSDIDAINERIDRLENLLCDLCLDRQDGESIKVGELRKELLDSGVLQGVEEDE